MNWFTTLGILTIILILGFALNRILYWAGMRGWVFNKHNPRPSGGGIPLGIFDEIFQPSIEHVIDERTSERIRADQAESGDGFDPLEI